LVIAVGQRLTADEPKALQQEGRQERCRDALRQVEAKAAKHAKAVGHHVQSNLTSLNGGFQSPERAVQTKKGRTWRAKQESRPGRRLSALMRWS
jgi:hypothetical protein